MAQTPKSWQDAFTASFGQESEGHGTQAVDKNGLVVGGVYQATPPTIADGEFSRLQTDGSGNLMVNLAAGEVISATVNVGTINAATITTGTINTGTIRIDARPTQTIKSYGTTFGGTAAGYGTIVGSPGVGTSIWINDLSIVNTAGTLTALIGFGTALNGTSVLAKGNFGPQGGIQKSFPLAVNAGMTNNDLVVYVAAAGTVDAVVSYFISA